MSSSSSREEYLFYKKVEAWWKLDGKSFELIAYHFTSGTSAHPGGLQESHVASGTMEETARGVWALAKAEALEATLIPYILPGFETCEAPEIGVVEAACVPMLAGVDASIGIGGTVVKPIG